MVEERTYHGRNASAAVCFFGGNRKCADLFLDSVYDRRSISDGRVHLFLL